jgi:hypothetical protein
MKKQIRTIRMSRKKENNNNAPVENNPAVNARHRRDSLIHSFQKQAGE